MNGQIIDFNRAVSTRFWNQAVRESEAILELSELKDELFSRYGEDGLVQYQRELDRMSELRFESLMTEKFGPSCFDNED